MNDAKHMHSLAENPYQSPADIEGDQEILSEAEKERRMTRWELFKVLSGPCIGILAAGALVVGEKCGILSPAQRDGYLAADAVLSVTWAVFFRFSRMQRKAKEAQLPFERMSEELKNLREDIFCSTAGIKEHLKKMPPEEE